MRNGAHFLQMWMGPNSAAPILDDTWKCDKSGAWRYLRCRRDPKGFNHSHIVNCPTNVPGTQSGSNLPSIRPGGSNTHCKSGMAYLVLLSQPDQDNWCDRTSPVSHRPYHIAKYSNSMQCWSSMLGAQGHLPKACKREKLEGKYGGCNCRHRTHNEHPQQFSCV